MRNDRYSTRIRSSLAIVATTIGLVAGASLPAAARVNVAMQPGSAAHQHVRTHRHIIYTPVQPGPTFVPAVPPDYCDLPSAGCESYLSN